MNAPILRPVETGSTAVISKHIYSFAEKSLNTYKNESKNPCKWLDVRNAQIILSYQDYDNSTVLKKIKKLLLNSYNPGARFTKDILSFILK